MPKLQLGCSKKAFIILTMMPLSIKIEHHISVIFLIKDCCWTNRHRQRWPKSQKKAWQMLKLCTKKLITTAIEIWSLISQAQPIWMMIIWRVTFHQYLRLLLSHPLHKDPQRKNPKCLNIFKALIYKLAIKASTCMMKCVRILRMTSIWISTRTYRRESNLVLLSANLSLLLNVKTNSSHLNMQALIRL